MQRLCACSRLAFYLSFDLFYWAVASSDDEMEEFVSDSLQASSEDFVEVAERMMKTVLVSQPKGKTDRFAFGVALLRLLKRPVLDSERLVLKAWSL